MFVSFEQETIVTACVAALETVAVKHLHEIRDPIHNFVRIDNDERFVVNSRPFQRLREIHQLSMSYLVYPGATHKRFEHSLGVMELASRIFDVVTNNASASVVEQIPQLGQDDQLRYWRRVLRLAALCHDIGHLPFSHAAEDLLPDGWDHERLTAEILASDEMEAVFNEMEVPVRPEDVSKLAVGLKGGGAFNTWEAILSEIIVSDVFGADRMDYLLRDSHHVGVAYGRFDQYRLIDTLRILPAAPAGEGDDVGEPTLGVEEGGLHSAEALLLARYFMYSQVYFHHVRRIYDIHLQDFLSLWLPGGKFSTATGEHLEMTDSEVLSAIHASASDETSAAHDPAMRTITRKHFRLIYERHPADLKLVLEPGKAIAEAAQARFGADVVRRDGYTQKGASYDFPIRTRDDRIASSVAMSEALKRLPLVAVDYVFVAPERLTEAEAWIAKERESILKSYRDTEKEDGE